MNTIYTKKCSHCHCDKAGDEYYKHPSTRDKLCHICKECDKAKKRNKRTRKEKPMKIACEYQTEKPCTICGEIKSLDNFCKNSKGSIKYASACKKCYKEKYRPRYVGKYKEKASARGKLKYLNNREDHLKKVKLYRAQNPDKIREIKKRPWYRITCQIRMRTNEVLSKKNLPSGTSLPYSIKQLKIHFESKMREGMSWDNYGEWCVDHIKPVCLWDMRDSNQIALMNGLDNLQCLWLKENEYKGKNYDPDHPMGWHGLDKFLIERGEPTPWLVG